MHDRQAVLDCDVERADGLVDPTRPQRDGRQRDVHHPLGPPVAAVAGLDERALGQLLGLREAPGMDPHVGEQPSGPGHPREVADGLERGRRLLEAALGLRHSTGHERDPCEVLPGPRHPADIVDGRVGLVGEIDGGLGLVVLALEQADESDAAKAVGLEDGVA